MRFGLLAVVGLMAGVGAAVAQQASEPGRARSAIVEVQPGYAVVGVGCPGAFQARQQAAGGAAVWTTALEDEHDKAAWTARPSGLGIHVDFTGAKSPVKALEVRVSYLPLKLRLMPAGPETKAVVEESAQERAKTFNLDRTAAMRIGGDLLVGPAATITRVHLMSATFADGSVWRASSEDQCSIVPSKFMLVEAKK